MQSFHPAARADLRLSAFQCARATVPPFLFFLRIDTSLSLILSWCSEVWREVGARRVGIEEGVGAGFCLRNHTSEHSGAPGAWEQACDDAAPSWLSQVWCEPNISTGAGAGTTAPSQLPSQGQRAWAQSCGHLPAWQAPLGVSMVTLSFLFVASGRPESGGD